jgi:energy-converting hydrogenase Eha subunit B
MASGSCKVHRYGPKMATATASWVGNGLCGDRGYTVGASMDVDLFRPDGWWDSTLHM